MKTTYKHSNGTTYNVLIEGNKVTLNCQKGIECPKQTTLENFKKLVNIEDYLPKDKKDRGYTEIYAWGNRRAGTVQKENKNGLVCYHINDIPVVEVLTAVNNKNTCALRSTVGYQLEGKPETRQKTLKALISSFNN